MAVVPSSELMHYGTKRHSGRYPWGSGETPYQHEAWFKNEIDRLRRQENYTDKELAAYFDMTTREFVRQRSLAVAKVREDNRAQAQELYSQGLSKSEIARRLGVGEGTIRNYLKPVESDRQARVNKVADILDSYVSEGKFLDIGEGVAMGLGVNQTQFELAVQKLKNEKGYVEKIIYVPQVNDKNQTTIVKVLCPPGTERDDILSNQGNIALVNERFVDQTGVNVYGLKPIKSISSKRVAVRYEEDGGGEKDGVIELRRGAEGLDLGASHYAQVRIAVDGTHYLKGMALYSDDMPDGVDIVFNTSKHKGGDKLDALKPFDSDPDNPFGAQIKPGGQKGYLNIVSEEGDWGEWSKNLASQFLSKQPEPLARQQLYLAKTERDREYEEIMGLTNPALRRHMLTQFADKCDTAAVSLKAAAMPRQATHVILPLQSLGQNEIYAPNYDDGERVVLVRYPHAGIFELPQLVVNNRNPEGKRLLGSASDAVGIGSKVAAQLSGADFDGDTVVVIPDRKGQINTEAAKAELVNFVPKEAYPATASTPRISVKNPKTGKMEKSEKTISVSHKNEVMGEVSNLITDMTIKEARPNEIIRAVKYSMVVIDSEKHNLDYKKAERDFDIKSLKKKYQAHPNAETGKTSYGASTLISRAKSPVRVPKVRAGWKPDPETGEVLYFDHKNQKWYDKDGNEHIRTTAFPAMKRAKDARELSSGSGIESIYAEYANYMKALANRARKSAMAVKDRPYSKSAAQLYSAEVESLREKVRVAKAHAPNERKAQILANLEVKLKEDSTGNLTDKQKKKIKYQALARARNALGGSKPKVDISDNEWKAIQSGAVRKTLLEDILRYTDQEALKERSMPRDIPGLTPGQLALAKARLAAGYTQKEIADLFGVSASTISRAVRA